MSQDIEPAKRSAARYLATQAAQLDKSEMFFMAISAYALTLTQTNSDLPDRLWNLKRNDCEHWLFFFFLVFISLKQVI